VYFSNDWNRTSDTVSIIDADPLLILGRFSIFLLSGVPFKFSNFDVSIIFLIFDEAIDRLDLIARLALDWIYHRVLKEEVTWKYRTMFMRRSPIQLKESN